VSTCRDKLVFDDRTKECMLGENCGSERGMCM
jgi:hypothetical protein